MNSKHTPGPWKVQPDPELAELHPYHKNRFITAGPHSITDDEWADDRENQIIASMRDCQNQPANARLIASAPDLLAALEGLLQCVAPHAQITIERKGMAALQSDVRRAVEAIAKAKGEA